MVPVKFAFFAETLPIVRFWKLYLRELARFRYTIYLFLLIASAAAGQQIPEKDRFFQVSGIITDEESRTLSNVGVISLKLKRGTLSEKTGIYSIISQPGDTILFKALGFKRKLIILPDDFNGKRFNLDVVLHTDTIPIENVVVLPWKTYSEFISDMTSPVPVAPEIENMNKNIASVQAAVSNTIGVQVTPEGSFHNAMDQNFNMIATRNQYPANNLLNPFAWAKFINGVKNGLFKNQHFDKPAKEKVKSHAKTREKKKKRRDKI